MRIYIAGKITGLPEAVAFAEFERAERWLELIGHTPLNPMKMVDQTPGRPYWEYLAEAVHVVATQAEGVFMLANWRDSRGARWEHAYAEIFGLPIYYQASELPVGCDWGEVVSAE